MRNILATLCLLSVVAFAADRVITDLESSIKIKRTVLYALPDGGCAAQAFASVTQSDGAVKNEESAVVHTAGANRTTCLDILNTKAVLLFKASQGF